MSYQKIRITPEQAPGQSEEKMQEVLSEAASEVHAAIRRQFGMTALKMCELADFEDVLFYALHRAATVLDAEYGRVRLLDSQEATRKVLGSSLASIGAPQELIEAIAGPIRVDGEGESEKKAGKDGAVWWEAK